MTTIRNLPKTLIEAVQYFSDNANCVALVVEHFWPGGGVRSPLGG